MPHHEQGHGHEVNPVQVQKFLSGVNYPADRQDLVKKAQQEGASDDVVRTLKNLPDKRYNGPIDVSQAIGQQQ